MEQEFRALLLGSSTVSKIVGDRVNFGEHPQGLPLPAIVLSVVGNDHDLIMSGYTGLQEARIQVDCYGGDYGSAKQLSIAVGDLLRGYVGGGFKYIHQISERNDRARGSIDAQRPYRTSVDYSTAWRPIK